MKYLVSLEPPIPVPGGCRLSVVMSMTIILPGHVISPIISIVIRMISLTSDDFQYDYECTFSDIFYVKYDYHLTATSYTTGKLLSVALLNVI